MKPPSGGRPALSARLLGPTGDPLLGSVYVYRHALLRDAAYASLARTERAELHLRFARWLEADGRIHVVVPNGLSLHRLVGVEIGLLPEPLFLSESDAAQGHVRNYTLDSLHADVRQAGLVAQHTQPVFLKVLSNRQMLDWDWNLIEALHQVSQRLPEHGAEIYMVATAP
jgi:hypothetical protein